MKIGTNNNDHRLIEKHKIIIKLAIIDIHIPKQKEQPSNLSKNDSFSM